MNKFPQSKNVAILTNFQDFNPGYSLTGIVIEQIKMLLRYGHKVFLFVNEQFNKGYNEECGIQDLIDSYDPETGKENLKVLQRTKFMHLTDYVTSVNVSEEHVEQGEQAGIMYAEDFMKFKITNVFTHDYVFTGWNLPYAMAIRKADDILKKNGVLINWMHWIHSVPSDQRDWWKYDVYGNNHLLIFPNRTEIKRVADMFCTHPSNVYIIPHLKDIAEWYDFSKQTKEILAKYPKIMSSDILQVYPCSTDRLSAKQLDLVIKVFGYMKEVGTSVCLVAANQWATGRQRKEDIKEYIEIANNCGLIYGEEFIFTSEFCDNKIEKLCVDNYDDIESFKETIIDEGYEEDAKKITQDVENIDEAKRIFVERHQPYKIGVGRTILRQLQLLQSVFLFPTKEESFGLVGPEAAYSGALVITNRSLLMMKEVMSNYPPSYDFGSHNINHEYDDNYLRAIALSILNRVYTNEALMTKIYCKKRYCIDNIYYRYYLPAMNR